MKLASMKIDRKAQRKSMEASVAMDSPAYPYGLELRLDQDSLKALGMEDKLPKVGKSLKLEALVDVTSVSENDRAGGGKTCSVSLQITDLALSPAKSADASEQLYEGDK